MKEDIDTALDWYCDYLTYMINIVKFYKVYLVQYCPYKISQYAALILMAAI